jgi:aspartate aminotransferase/aminotransferase
VAGSTGWIADRTLAFDSSGIRKVFDLAAKLKDPVNLSIGQPDFDVPPEIQAACVDAIHSGKNAYTPSQGIAPLRERLLADLREKYGHADRDVFISSGTSGGLMLAMMAMINPGDEVIVFDPYFVMYPPLIKLAGGVPVLINSYPDFRIDLEKVRQSITSKTKMILFNSPGNPTGVTATEQEMRGIAELAKEHNVALISDEIYSTFHFDASAGSPAEFNDQTIVIDGFSKSHAMTGWRVGYVHGPSEIIQTLIKLQQFTFVCSPQPAQWASLAAMDVEMSSYTADYKRKRDFIVSELQNDFEFTIPGGAFYLFPKAPWGTGNEFVHTAIENELLIIPGKIFSEQDTHFRISFAASDKTLERGVEILKRIAKR